MQLELAIESATIICIWQRLRGRQRSRIYNKSFRCALIGSCWHGETGVK